MEPRNAGVAFLFSPQGSHYAGMGKALYNTFLPFAKVMDAAETLYSQLRRPSLKDALWKDDPSSLDDPDVCGPGIFALQVGLVQVLRSFGIVPTSVLGHSFGEYAAAVCAGVLSFEDGFRLVLGRALLITSKVKEGRMTALRATAETVNQALAKFELEHGTPPEVAAFNAEDSIVVGGSLEIISAFEIYCFSIGIEFMRLSASAPFAYHTSAMDPILDDLASLTSAMAHAPPTLKFISSSTGGELGEGEFGGEYWRGLSRNPIQFSKAIRLLCSSESVLVEIGPTPKLINLVLRNFKGNPPQVLYAMSQEEPCTESLLRCLSQLSCKGVEVDWNPWFQRNVEERSEPTLDPPDFVISVNSTRKGVLEKVSRDGTELLEPLSVEIAVMACSLNYKDKVIFQNGNHGKGELGFDLAGIVRRVGTGVTSFKIGDQVYGISLTGGCLASTVNVPQMHLAKIPPTLTPTAASTFPLTYLIAWKALVDVGGIGTEDRILVNFGRGWIGIALAHIALHFGSQVFALSGSPERTKHLESLGVSHIYDLVHGIDFASLIRKDTHGKGLTLVVNNFEDPFLKELSLGLCSSDGKFVDVAPRGHWTPEDAYLLRSDVTHSVVDVMSGSQVEIAGMWDSLTAHFESGSFPPFPQKIFPVDSVTDVFDWFENGKLGMAKPVILMPPPRY